ncbi:MAG TPA: hypothetical protein VKW08_07340 [Xanthobacteraceae bacterium]|jgi:hypothetical protein|nr:hypothetical protein [Xanthobacteraceae bacterium]
MLRTKWIFVPAIAALALAFGTPAMALNPQPLPPGLKHSPVFRTSQAQIFCKGTHLPRVTSARFGRQ